MASVTINPMDPTSILRAQALFIDRTAGLDISEPIASSGAYIAPLSIQTEEPLYVQQIRADVARAAAGGGGPTLIGWLMIAGAVLLLAKIGG